MNKKYIIQEKDVELILHLFEGHKNIVATVSDFHALKNRLKNLPTFNQKPKVYYKVGYTANNIINDWKETEEVLISSSGALTSEEIIKVITEKQPVDNVEIIASERITSEQFDLESNELILKTFENH